MQETGTFVRKASIHGILENVKMPNFPLNILFLHFCFVLYLQFYFSSKNRFLNILQEQSVLEFCTIPGKSISWIFTLVSLPWCQDESLSKVKSVADAAIIILMLHSLQYLKKKSVGDIYSDTRLFTNSALNSKLITFPKSILLTAFDH